jgi:hypothetical protein
MLELSKEEQEYLNKFRSDNGKDMNQMGWIEYGWDLKLRFDLNKADKKFRSELQAG